MSPGTELRELLEQALAAVHEAGAAVMESFRRDPEVRHKSPDQPVTEADLAADRILARHLHAGSEEVGWLSEETADRPDRLDRRRVWIVDPIDGTRSFIAGYREFGISVGLAEAGEPVLGVIYNPARRDLFWAIRGAGAHRIEGWDGSGRAAVRLRLAGGPRGDDPRALLASRSEIGRGEFEPFDDFEIRPVGSTAYKLAGVAAGAGHGFVSRGPKSEWDVIAGDLIVREAGGRVTDLSGRGLVYNRPDPYVHGVVAAAPGVHAVLLERCGTLPTPRLRDRPQPSTEGTAT